MQIRKIEKRDIQEVAKFWLALVYEVYPDFNPNVDWWIEETEDLFDSGNYMGYVAEEAGRMIGFTDAFIYPDSARGVVVGFSRHTYVLPDLRHTNATKDLFRTIYAEARERGAKLAMFNCTDELLPLWLAHGYRFSENVMVGVI